MYQSFSISKCSLLKKEKVSMKHESRQVGAGRSIRVIPPTPGSVGKKIGAVKYLTDSPGDAGILSSCTSPAYDESCMTTRARSKFSSPGVKRRSCVLFMLSYDM